MTLLVVSAEQMFADARVSLRRKSISPGPLFTPEKNVYALRLVRDHFQLAANFGSIDPFVLAAFYKFIPRRGRPPPVSVAANDSFPMSRLMISTYRSNSRCS
jgi:hypothetical protein